MNNNLPIEFKKGILYKIKIFFKELFTKKNIQPNVQTIDRNTLNEPSKENFKNKVYVPEIESIQREKNTKESIINMVEKNPKLLETMSIVNLKKLTQLYDEIIENNNKKIRLLKSKT